MDGKMIVIEGLDGSGKSTQIELLSKRLLDEGIESFRIKLPYYDDKSSELVKMYLAGELTDMPASRNSGTSSMKAVSLSLLTDIRPQMRFIR